MAQVVYAGIDTLRHMSEIVSGAKRPFVVCKPRVKESLPRLDSTVYFDQFTPNPMLADVLDGVALFERESCDFMVSVGGGSAIDVAKGINILQGDDSAALLDAPRARHLTVPTTAGTGSESTCFSVLYKDGEKISVEQAGILPEFVILDPVFLRTLPLYHKKSALLDALCQALESLWAKGKTPTSKAYALDAIDVILADMDGYLAGDDSSALRILQAANLSGKAINIGKTTAAHAMSYKLSTVFGIAHGHAVALCLPYVAEHLLAVGAAPSEFSQKDYDRFVSILIGLDMAFDFAAHGDVSEAMIASLAASVNPGRLGNHAVDISTDTLASMYRKVLENAVFSG
ncbi:MAG: phosphonoacetaldehyde reductase [Oscillospiraceae bacterium]|nr:phosphonoacetaldehyde reductase [Oscillospiraceae bacterium]